MTDTATVYEMILSDLREIKCDVKNTDKNMLKLQEQSALTQIAVEEFKKEFSEVIYGNQEKNETGLKKTVSILHTDYTKRKLAKKIVAGIVIFICTTITWLTANGFINFTIGKP